jgi:UDP-glucuronate 4-epimerase
MKKKTTKIKILVTGCAGFIGFHVCKYFLQKNCIVLGIDNINNYYDTKLKNDRLSILQKFLKFSFYKLDISNVKKMNFFFKKKSFDYVVHLAAQAGVRFSIYNPDIYFKSNLDGFFNVLNLSHKKKVKHFIFASSSSVYGDQKKFPLKETYRTDFPKSFYAATKKSNEILAYSYSAIYKMRNTGLRFFTLYGPFGRPDMAIYKFTNSILNNKKIELFNKGNHFRDFTHISTILPLIYKLITKPSKEKIPFNMFNIGSGKSEKLINFIKLIELNLNKKSKIKKMPIQRGDVYKTHSSIKHIKNYLLEKKNSVIKSLPDGIKDYVDWFKVYYSK